MIDDKNRTINQLVVKTGHRLTGKKVQVPLSQVERISCQESTVYVKLNKAGVETSPEYRLAPNGAATSAEPILAL